jgi:urease accessory protein
LVRRGGFFQWLQDAGIGFAAKIRHHRLRFSPLHRKDFAMTSIGSTTRKTAALAILLLSAAAAQAHTGHGTTSLAQGLAHPFGLDHMLAMVAVGIWSVNSLPQGKAWWGPLTFMAALVASAALGTSGVTLPYLEHMVSLSVVAFGAMLVMSRVKLPLPMGLGVVALAASMHGLAHGAETPASGFAGYAVGFLFTTAALHFGGVLAGVGLRRYVSAHAVPLTQTLGGLCSGAGLYLLHQLS